MSKPSELSASLALGWSLLLTLGLVTVGVVVGVGFGTSNAGVVAGCLAEVLLILPAVSWLGKLYGQGDARRDYALAGASPLELLIGASLGVGLHLPAGYVSELIERRFPTPAAELQAELAMLTPSSKLMAAAMLIGVAVVVPYIEELYFRGALFTPLLRSGPPFVAVWTTSLAFVLAHQQQPRNWAPLLIVAVALAELRRMSGSIWAGVTLHAAFNGATLLSVFVARPTEVKTQSGSWQAAAIGSVLCVAGVWLFGRVAKRRLAENG